MKSFLSTLEKIREGVRLSPAQMKKPNGNTGEQRIDILARLIRDGKPLELSVVDFLKLLK